jgi:hypothetical protein
MGRGGKTAYFCLYQLLPIPPLIDREDLPAARKIAAAAKFAFQAEFFRISVSALAMALQLNRYWMPSIKWNRTSRTDV